MTDAAKRETGCICGRPHQDFCPAGLLPPRPAGDAGTERKPELIGLVEAYGMDRFKEGIAVANMLSTRLNHERNGKKRLAMLAELLATAARQAREEIEAVRKQLRRDGGRHG